MTCDIVLRCEICGEEALLNYRVHVEHVARTPDTHYDAWIEEYEYMCANCRKKISKRVKNK